VEVMAEVEVQELVLAMGLAMGLVLGLDLVLGPVAAAEDSHPKIRRTCTAFHCQI
jgi:hypothetical protein